MPPLRTVSESTMSRYEQMIAQLTTQALSQQEEITKLREALEKTCITQNKNSNNNKTSGCKRESGRRNKDVCVDLSQGKSRDSTEEYMTVFTKSERSRRGASRKGSGRRRAAAWRHTVEEYAVGLLETYVQHMDERLAYVLAERLRRVTREHVVRSVEKELRRVLQGKQGLPQHLGENEQQQQRYTPNCNACARQHDLCITLEEGKKEKVKSLLGESTPPACMNCTTGTVASDSVTVSPQQVLGPQIVSCDVQSTSIESAQCATLPPMYSTSCDENNLAFESCNVTGAYVSTISVDPSSSDSFGSLYRKHDHSLVEHLQQKVALLEERLYTATALDPGMKKSPPSVEKTCYYAEDKGNANNSDNNNNNNNNNNSSNRTGTHSCCSPQSLTDSSSGSSACDDIEVLVDVFEGRKQPKDIRRLLLRISD